MINHSVSDSLRDMVKTMKVLHWTLCCPTFFLLLKWLIFFKEFEQHRKVGFA